MDPNANLKRPNANLKRQRELLATLRETGGSEIRLVVELAAMLVELAELSEAMDDWLSKGGYLPAAWTLGPGQVPYRY